MERLIQHIEYLLDRHECVVVPGFGAFLARYTSAHVDYDRRVILPPSRVVTFNGEMTYDDGLLAASYARQGQVSYTVALSQVQEDVSILKAELTNGETTFGSLGTLAKNQENHYIFIVGDCDYVQSGLCPVAFVADDVVGNGCFDSVPAVLPAPSRFTRRAHGFMKYAAMFILLLTMGIVVSTPVIDTSGVETVKANLCPLQIASPVVEEQYPEFLICEPVELVEEPAIESVTEIRSCADPQYCLVIASLASRDQADEFIASAGDDALGMFMANGRYRVYAATGRTVSAVMIPSLVEKYSGAWPCALPSE